MFRERGKGEGLKKGRERRKERRKKDAWGRERLGSRQGLCTMVGSLRFLCVRVVVVAWLDFLLFLLTSLIPAAPVRPGAWPRAIPPLPFAEFLAPPPIGLHDNEEILRMCSETMGRQLRRGGADSRLRIPPLGLIPQITSPEKLLRRGRKLKISLF